MYFGIGEETAYTLEEIGIRFDLTRERVRQIKEKALKRLKHASRARKLIHHARNRKPAGGTERLKIRRKPFPPPPFAQYAYFPPPPLIFCFSPNPAKP
jgi:hypothetical protein